MNLKTIGLIAGISALVSPIATASAQEVLHVGDTGNIRNSMLCDTAEQLLEFLNANAEGGFNAGFRIYQRHHRTLNDSGNPTCRYIAYNQTAVVGEMIDSVHGVDYDDDGNKGTLYVVEMFVDGHLYYSTSSFDVLPAETPTEPSFDADDQGI